MEKQSHSYKEQPTHSHDKAHEHGQSHEPSQNGIVSVITHFFKPHSHDSADSIDDALEGSKEGIKTLKISFIILGVTALFQVIIVLISGSVALLADTIHNFADASTAIPLWIAFSLGRRVATKRYTYGFGRAEDIAGIFIVLMIAGSALLAGWESVQKLLYPQAITHIAWVIVASLIGFVGNEWVAQYRINTGNKIGSSALVADGYHARIDGFTSLAVLFGAIGVLLGFPQADPLVGLGITVAILFILKDVIIQVWHRLMDAVEPELIEKAKHAASHVTGVQSIASIRMRWVGHSLHAEADVVADCELTLAKAHDIAEEARHAMLHAVPKLTKVTVHVDPCGHNGENPHKKLVHHDQKTS